MRFEEFKEAVTAAAGQQERSSTAAKIMQIHRFFMGVSLLWSENNMKMHHFHRSFQLRKNLLY